MPQKNSDIPIRPATQSGVSAHEADAQACTMAGLKPAFDNSKLFINSPNSLIEAVNPKQ